MMEYLIKNFIVISSFYMNLIIEGYLFCVSLLFAYWLKPFTRKQRAAYLSALMSWILQTINNHTGSNKETDRLISVGILLFVILLVWMLDDRRNPIQKLFLCVVFRLISWITIEIFTEIGLFEGQLTDRFDWYRYSIEATVVNFFVWNFMEYGLALLVLYLSIRVLHKAYRHKTDELTWRELLMLLTPAGTLLLVKPIMASYFLLWMKGIENGSIKENISENPYRLFFSIFSFFPILIIITQYQKLKEKQVDEFTRKSVEDQIANTHRHVEHIEELYDKMRGMRHDFGNHLMVIERLAENGKTEELTEYIGELWGHFEELQSSVKTGNAVTDVILSEIHDRCRNSEITFESRFVYPKELAINPFDMSVILTNALQNAVEASQDVEKPMILILSIVRERVFIINVRNKESKKAIINEDGIPDTTKLEPGHGYGLKNIRSIAQKYKGDLEVRQEEAEEDLFFVLNIMLMG